MRFRSALKSKHEWMSVGNGIGFRRMGFGILHETFQRRYETESNQRRTF